MKLNGILANRQWLSHVEPFPHVTARNVLTEETYQALADQIRALLDRGLSEVPDLSRFARNMTGYDAYGIGLDEKVGEPATVFISPAWRDLMCGLFGIEPTPYLFGGLHHHVPGSRSGFVHNDFNPVWFARARDECIRIPDHGLCNFKDGSGVLTDEEKIQTIRGAVVLFFLLNDGWTDGDGGEIGLFRTPTAPPADAVARVAPINNSVVAFECTPKSYHAFLTNPARARTSIIIWVHRTMDDAARAHGLDGIERWQI